MAQKNPYAGEGYYPEEVVAMHDENATKVYDKIEKPNGATEYTIRYQQSSSFNAPSFTKILVDKNNEILAYIDVQHIPQQYQSQFKRWKWFGIQEFHPELIGDFQHIIDKTEGNPYYRDTWTHKTEEHLYILDTSQLSKHQDWYRVGNNAFTEGFITTNFGILDGSVRNYRYNTHPNKPTPRIEALKNEILIKMELLNQSSSLPFRQKIRRFFQKCK